MSEKKALYLSADIIPLENCINISIDKQGIGVEYDSIVLKRVGPGCVYTVAASKDNYVVWQLKDERVVDSVYYDNIPGAQFTYYEIITKLVAEVPTTVG